MLTHLKFLDADAAVALIPNGATVVIGGTGPSLEADAVLKALEERFLREGAPSKLTVVSPALPGDQPGKGGLNCVAHEGMLRKIIGASFSVGRHPRLIDLVRSESCEGYIVGMGTLVQLMGAAAQGKPGVLTTVGIGSFLDPRNEGGRMNARSTEQTAQVQQVEGREYLFYKTIPVDVAIIRGTTADENGYISFEDEPNTLAMLEIASAARASGGIVIAQVKRVARANSLDPRLVRIPGPLVDVVVVNEEQTQVSPGMMNPSLGVNPFFSGALKTPLGRLPRLEDPTQRAMMRRTALELRPNDVINVGVGVATNLPRIALEEGILEHLTFTNEHGIFGGIFASAIGKSFVPAFNADAIMDSTFQFGLYESGGLTAAFLGIGEIDADGNVNVSKFGSEWNGPGGFNSITDRTKRLVFCGSLTAGGLDVSFEGGQVKILREGKHRKFVAKVEQVTLNAARAWAQGQQVLYITERAVFDLDEQGLRLIEVAPGIDVERDVRAQVGFALRVAPNLRTTDPRVYRDGPMNLAAAFGVRKPVMRLGCIADDFTGATDLANNLVRGGLRVLQTIGIPRDELMEEVDAVVVALKTRTVPAAQAVEQSLAALQWLRARGAEQIYFKYCSTFDSTAAGNIGPVAEALMNALACDFAIATPAFPDNGRTVFKGHLFVGDVLLNESGMQDHPLTPMRDANLVRVLQAQCRGRVGLVDHRSVAESAQAIRARFAALQTAGASMAVVDAVSNEDLMRLGAALAGARLVTGGSGVAIGLPQNWNVSVDRNAAALPARGGHAAVISGSCSLATNRQVAAFIASGRPALPIDPTRAIAEPRAVISEALAWAASRLGATPLLIHSTAGAEQVRDVQRELGAAQAGDAIEAVLAGIARGLVERGARRLVVAGGETSGACVQALAIEQLRIGAQIDPGVPWCHARSGLAPEGIHLALKSGNFGSDDFFTKAFAAHE